MTALKGMNHQKVVGLCLIFATAVIWIAASFVSEYLLGNSRSGQQWHIHPFLLTYLATSLFTFYLPIAHLRQFWREGSWRRQVNHEEGQESGELAFGDDTNTERQGRTAALWALPLWFGGQLTYNLSLAYTSVTSNTILSSTSSLFTFMLSMALLKERFTLRKLFSIIACIIGSALVTLSDNSGDGAHRQTWGDLLCLVSAGLYGAYTVMMKKKLPDEAHADVMFFFGYMGLFCTVVLLPVLVGLVLGGAIPWGDIPRSALGLVLLEGVLDYVLADYLWARAVLLLGPTIATLGLSIQIPMAAVADLFLGSPTWVRNGGTIAMTLLGTLLILVGFVEVNLSDGSEVQAGENRAQTGPTAAQYLPVLDTEDEMLPGQSRKSQDGPHVPPTSTSSLTPRHNHRRL